MKKSTLCLAVFIIAAHSYSQSLDDGIKFIYYGKTKSAIQVLDKVVASKPKDALSVYWLGQAYLDDYRLSGYTNADDYAKAKSLYQQAAKAGINDPWIWIANGQIALYEHNNDGAKQLFEQAINATKGKKGVENADILNAVGRANAFGGSKYGDVQYGIDVLKRAAAIDPKNPDIDINLGINYLKQGGDYGGDAVQAFTDATVRDPKYAAAYYHIGLIYGSQDNKPAMDDWFGKAIAADPAYGPVYFAYFDYYKDKDVNAARDYLDSYVANSDHDCVTTFFQADFLFRAGKYNESLVKADSMAAGDCKTFTRLNILYALNYDRLGDAVKAKDAVQKFFTIVPAGNIQADDYTIAANVYKKIAGFEDSAIAYLTRAMDISNVRNDKIKYADTITQIYAKLNRWPDAVIWENKTIALKPGGATARDLYDLATYAMNAENLALADSVFTEYKTKYPDQAFGYSGSLKVAQKLDTTGTKAVGPINDYIGFLMKDTATNAQAIAYYHAILGGYYANTAKNVDSAVSEFQLAVHFDPANEQYKKYYDILYKAQQKRKGGGAAQEKQAAGKQGV
ncbi:MAG TPA: hypothetical protein VG738_11165 [Chitinophagaceae bacterium]|nr:hypothetical protein [Chitinophagaceae bacterium]